VSAHKFTKKDLKQDSFVSNVERAMEWGQKNATVIGVVLLVLVVVLVGGSYLRTSQRNAALEASAMLYRGQNLVAQGDFQAAMGPLQDCVDQHGDSEFANYARVSIIQALLAMNETEVALARVGEFKDAVPADHPAHGDLGVLEAYVLASAGKPGEAADAMEPFATRDLSDRMYYDRTVQRAEWLLDAGRAGEGIALLEGLDAAIRDGELDVAVGELEKRLAVARALRS
jgi:tetratricopeptide (TPR) repeat protein